MAIRTAVMHDDLGGFTGPASYQRITTIQELVDLIQASSQASQTYFIAGRLTLDVAVDLIIPQGVWLVFVEMGEFVVNAGSVDIQCCVLAPMGKRIFTGNCYVTNTDCMQSKRWYGQSGGWYIPNLYGDINIDGKVVAKNVVAEAMSIAGCDVLTVCGGTMLGPLYLFRDPVGDMEAATRGWVIEQLTSGGVLDIRNYSKIVFKNFDGSTIEMIPEDHDDTLVISFGETLCVSYTDIELLYDTNNADPVTPATLDLWFEDLNTGSGTAPQITAFGDPGVTLDACP